MAVLRIIEIATISRCKLVFQGQPEYEADESAETLTKVRYLTYHPPQSDTFINRVSEPLIQSSKPFALFDSRLFYIICASV